MKTLLVSLLIFVSIGYAQPNPNTSTNTIILNIVKDSTVTADEMVVEISVRKSDTSSTKVNEISHSDLLNVLNILEKNGYKKNDIYLISSGTNNDNFRKKEFFSTQTYKVILNKFDLYDQLKKDLLQAGATSVSISTFWYTDYEKVKQTLYDKTIAEAKSKANYFCSQIGAKNPIVESIWDNSRNESINNNLTFMTRSGSVGLSAVSIVATQRSYPPTVTNGQINIEVSLRITFKYVY